MSFLWRSGICDRSSRILLELWGTQEAEPVVGSVWDCNQIFRGANNEWWQWWQWRHWSDSVEMPPSCTSKSKQSCILTASMMMLWCIFYFLHGVNDMHSAACSSPREALKDVIPQRALLSESTHKWSLDLFEMPADLLGWVLCSRERSHQAEGWHPLSRSWWVFACISQDWAMRFSLLSMPNPLGQAPKASWVQRTAQRSGNCHCPVINLPCLAIPWIYIDSPLIYTAVSLESANDCLAQREPCSTSVTCHELTQGPHTHHLQLPRRFICTDTGRTHFFAEIMCAQYELWSKLTLISPVINACRERRDHCCEWLC